MVQFLSHSQELDMKKRYVFVAAWCCMLVATSAASAAGYSTAVGITNMEVIDSTGTSRVFLLFSCTSPDPI
jgi:hypothetical protein